MAKKYTYSRTIHTIHGMEMFSAVEFDSFDEAVKAVDKGIHDRKLEIGHERAIDALPFPPGKILGGAGLAPSGAIRTEVPATMPAVGDNGGDAPSNSAPAAHVPDSTSGI